MTETTVEPGQIWADNDWRADGREVRVISTDATHADVEVVAVRNASGDRSEPGRPSRICLDRFRPTSTGYRLVQYADGTPAVSR
jgi:hypothetical protein